MGTQFNSEREDTTISILTLRSDVLNHPETSVLQSITDMVRKSGLLTTADFVVGEAGAGGLKVDISTGRAYVKGAATNAYPIRSTTTVTPTFTSNSSGNSRIDAVVLYIDLSVTPNPSGGGDDVALIKVVAGTPAGSPVAPDSSAIQSSVGASNPWLRLADCTVTNGATGISAAQITNTQQRVFISTHRPLYTETYSATVTPDFLNGDKQKVTLTGNITFVAPTNFEIGDAIELQLTQDGTGSRTVTWFNGITWLSPDYSINASANKKSVYIIEKTGAASYNGYLAGKEY